MGRWRWGFGSVEMELEVGWRVGGYVDLVVSEGRG